MSMQLYQLSPTEDLTLAMLLLRPHPLFNPEATQEKVWVTKERFGSVPRVYIICDQDNIMKEALQRWIIENNPPDEVKVVSGSDHMLMFSKASGDVLLSPGGCQELLLILSISTCLSEPATVCK
ncbi:hypothetical protein OIU84_029969 [Salix udensis]|uniref:Uncharacterized protein n=1 Tax=Salix udensis TaxID=889485 RepID=A0AAD6P8Y2_9ROSI|nr:hypothetical protein OIU84_029969 [Salix udensis]